MKMIGGCDTRRSGLVLLPAEKPNVARRNYNLS
jgi:hypothetical protein